MSDQQLLLALSGDDDHLRNETIKLMYKEFKRITFTICNDFNISPSDVDDIHQESIIGLVKSITFNTFRGDSKLSSYFYQICKFQAMNKKKSPPMMS